MKTFRSLTLILVALAASVAAQAQTALTQTTLSAAITSSRTTFALASTTGITANNTLLYVDNEAMFVNAVSGAQVSVTRGANGTKAFAHVSGAGVLAGPPAAFISYDPSGSCSNTSGLFLYSPVVNTVTGNQWLCSINGQVSPGWGNNSAAPNSTAAVASVAGVITPSGPLFHITGGNAITGFTLPVGFDPKSGQTFCVIPDGAFTTTNAGNIAIASTAGVSKTLCWTYDPNAAKPFFPSY